MPDLVGEFRLAVCRRMSYYYYELNLRQHCKLWNLGKHSVTGRSELVASQEENA